MGRDGEGLKHEWGGGAIERKILLDVDVEGSRTDSCWFCCCSHQKNSILLRGGGGGIERGSGIKGCKIRLYVVYMSI